MTEQKPMVYQAIVNVMKKVNAVPKNAKNRDQGFAYRSIDAVMAELHDIMADEGLFVVPTVLETNDSTRTTKSGAEWNHVRATIAYDFYATDGSTIRAVVRGEALDSGDKASNKALAIALKYVTTQTFMIPTEEAKDPDENTPEEVVKTTKTTAAQTTALVDGENGKATAVKVLYGVLYGKGLDAKKVVPLIAAQKGHGSIGALSKDEILEIAKALRELDGDQIMATVSGDMGDLEKLIFDK